MDAEEYEALCSRPDVFRDVELLEVVRLLRAVRSPQAALLQAALLEPPIEKPPRYRGGWNFVRLDLSREHAQEILDELLDAEAAAVAPDPATERRASELGDLVERWGRYLEWLRSERRAG
jgi:hypothetical protein